MIEISIDEIAPLQYFVLFAVAQRTPGEQRYIPFMPFSFSRI
jgi:hypothetical protein